MTSSGMLATVLYVAGSGGIRRFLRRSSQTDDAGATDLSPANPVRIIDLDTLPVAERSRRSPLIYLCLFLDLPFDAGLSNDQAFNAIDFETQPLADWEQFDLQAFLGMPPLPQPAVRPCTVLRFRRVTNEVDTPFANVERAFGSDLPLEFPAADSLPPLYQSRSVVQAIRIAPHDTAEFGEKWIHEQFAIVLSVLNSNLIALGAAADDHRIAPIHELQLPSVVLGFQADLRDIKDGQLHDLTPFLLNLHKGRYGETEDHGAAVINRALAIAGQKSPGPFYPAMEFLFAARRSLDEGRLTHAVLESGTAIELLVSGVVLGIGAEKGWSEEKLSKVLSDKTGFRNRFVDHFSRAFGITVTREASGADPINTWLRVAYPLRNRVAHRGERPTNSEANDALRLAAELIDYAGQTAEKDAKFGITFPGFEELIPAPVLDERSLAGGRAPSESDVAREAFTEGLQAIERDDVGAAKRAFAESQRQGSVSGAYNLGILHLADGDEAAAIEALGQAADQGHPGASSYLGVLRLAAGETAQAESLLREGLPPAHPTGGPLAAYFLATIVGGRGEHHEAADLYRQAAIVDDFPLAPEAAFRRGAILEELGDPGAIDAFRRASALGSAKGATNLANHLAADGRIEEAMDAHRRAIALSDPEVTGRAHFNLAVLLEGEGRLDEAEEEYRQATACGEPRSQLALAEFAAKRNDLTAAREHLRAARSSNDGEVSEAAVEMARELRIPLR